MIPPEYLIAIDVETTGLDARRCAILEIGALCAARPHQTFTCTVLPWEGCLVEPAAQAVHGILTDDPAWRAQALDPTSAAHALTRWIANLDLPHVAWLGHNVGFDMAFLLELFRRVRIPAPDLSVSVCTRALAASCGHLRVSSLDAVTAAYGIARPSPHRALEDARTCLLVYWALRGERPDASKAIR